MPKAVSYGFIEAGKLHLANRKRFAAELQAFKDCDIILTVKKRGKRSTAQNDFYWGVVIEEIRYNFLERGERMEPEQVHEFLKFHFNKKYLHDEHGEVLAELPGSTAEMNVDEFSEYLFRIMEWAAKKLGLAISEPNEQTQLNFD